MAYRILLFLVLNFGALGIGSALMGGGPSSEWYLNLNKAPWTPPGWSFGVAWTAIMVCFAIYMSYGWSTVSNRTAFMILFGFQWIINVLWNPAFFRYHQVFYALIIIFILTALVTYFLISYWSEMKLMSVFILPYFLWLLVATSLNAYIYFNNSQ